MHVRRLPRFALLAALAALGAAAAWVASTVPDARAARAPVLPAWSIEGEYDQPIPVGFASLAGKYDFTLDSRPGTLSLSFDSKARLTGGGGIDLTFYSVSTETTVDEGGAQHLRVMNAPRNPTFTFDGVVQANGIDVAGTAWHADGFAGIAGDFEGPMTLRRLYPLQAYRNFILRMTTRMDTRGRVRGETDGEGKELTVRLDVFAEKILTGGRVRGRVRTSRVDGTTKTTLNVRGKGWRVFLKGPVDETGFHAVATIRAAGFVLKGVEFDLPVSPGPEPPPPPPPPPPANQIGKCVAKISGSNVTITRENAPRKFFGRGADLTCDFPLAILSAQDETLVADPTTAGGVAPVRFFVRVGARSYLASSSGASVTLHVPRDNSGTLRFSTVPGKTMYLECKGSIRDASGRTKAVDVILEAVVSN